ncbi:MAG: DUF4145 domain-containing protein [Candidatus Bathyarchaeota archaeon]|jgi:hypothetical protein
MSSEYTPPIFEGDSYHCPHCGVYAHQSWYDVTLEGSSDNNEDPSETISISACENCERFSFWVEGVLVYPHSVDAPLPLDGMPEDIRAYYMEARSIVDDSPMAAAALLRFALVNLISHLGEKDDVIINLIELKKRGLDAKIQTALQKVRVIGKDAVEPGMIDPKDDQETAGVLFKLLNIIVDTLIGQPKRVNEILERLPGSDEI